MESGVPALFPANPIEFFRFYLPRSIFYRRPLFDDVNVPKLRHYIDQHKNELKHVLGADSWEVLCYETKQLAHYQQQWRSMTRLERGIQARLQRGEINNELAMWYQERPIQWYGRELIRGVLAVADRIRMWVAGWLNVATLQRLARGATKFILSVQFRADLARQYVALRIEKWNRQGQLNRLEFDYLIRELNGSEASVYITDFGVHMAIKPIVKAITWFALPFLYGIGAINETILAAGVVAGGGMGRTIYTAARLIDTIVRGVPKPWIAFFAGMVPVIGNASFPLQLVYESRDKGSSVAKFILYDVFTRLGEAIPVWGGEGTLSEHRLNHVGDFFISKRSPLYGDSVTPDKQWIRDADAVERINSREDKAARLQPFYRQ